MLFFCSTISSVVYLRCRMLIQAKPMNREKVLEQFTLQRRKKLLQTVHRLSFSYSYDVWLPLHPITEINDRLNKLC